ncbi:MAG: cytochrome c family protein [Deltaproteobacteria bacterium]|nr:cytochrome c family protein [Deltaproteobacteria bacterium]
MLKKGLLATAVLAFITVFTVGGLQAGTEVADTFMMKSDYPHKKGIVEFSHKKHNAEYGIACGECHHDADHKPLNDLKMGDHVKKCIECHKKPGEVPREVKKEWKAKKIKKKEKDRLSLEYHAEAVHENCRTCHKEYNKKTKTKDAPTTCSKCHPKQ